MRKSIDLMFAVPLDYSMFVEPSLLGSGHTIQLASVEAAFELPTVTDPWDGRRASLGPPPSAGKRLVTGTGGWGLLYVSGHAPVAEVQTILILVKGRAHFDFEIGADQVSGSGIDRLRAEVHAWMDSFICWVWSLTAQSLDASHPDPRDLHRRSTNIVHVVVAGEESSFAASGSPHWLL